MKTIPTLFFLLSFTVMANAQITFEARDELLFGSNNGRARSAKLIDLDQDGDKDIVCAYTSTDKIAWYENTDGLGTFGDQQIITEDAIDVFSIYPVDLDNDGDLDIISASKGDHKIAWYENDGTGNFGNQEIISLEADQAISIYVIDLDGDGDLDVLSASEGDDKIAWYKNEGTGSFGSQQIISTDAIEAASVFAGDLDGDGDADVLSISGKDDAKLVWYENLNGLGNFGSEQIISTALKGAKMVTAGDLDGDGDLDVLSASSKYFPPPVNSDNRIAWYENTNGLGLFGAQQIISSPISANSVNLADVDLDGDLDVLSTNGIYAANNTESAVWHENTDGLGTFGLHWKMPAINTDTPLYMDAGDVDGDGDQDLIASYNGGTNIIWYENTGEESNRIFGQTQFDANANDCDVLASPLSNIKINASDSVHSFSTFTNSNGAYFFNKGEGVFTVKPDLPNHFSAVPDSSIVNFVGLGNVDTSTFCLQGTQSINDLEVTLLELSAARPGFKSFYRLVFKNKGTTVLSGDLVLTYEEDKVTFVSASENVSSQSTNTLNFEFTDLTPLQSRSIDLELEVYPPPTVAIEEVLKFTAAINPIMGDATEADNYFCLEQTTVGSFDPNDIRVLEGDQILYEAASDFLHYIIRFQNTGNYFATKVKVINVLEEKLDWSTFQIQDYSHPCWTEISNENEVSFTFNGIYLPDSTSNEPESHGFVAYKIKPKSTVAVGDVIENEASIFFDFNEAIETNIATTAIVETVSNKNPALLDFTIYPSPAKNILNIHTTANIERMEIYNQLGQLLVSVKEETAINIAHLSPGIYFCKVESKKGLSGIKKFTKN